MNRTNNLLAGTVLAISLVSPALANVPTSVDLDGKVTGLPGGDRIEIDGRTYNIPPGSEAAQRLKDLHVGDRVDLKVEGSNKVVKVNVHAR